MLVYVETVRDGWTPIRLPRGADPAALVESLVRHGVRLCSLAPVRRSMEDLYMEIHNGAGSLN